jgi:hypothetical protein
MKVYVASKYEDHRARELMGMLRAAGHQITHDWTAVDESGASDERRRELAEQDLDGVARAEAFILIDSPACRGANVEFGYALAFAIPIIVVGRSVENIFFRLPGITHVGTLAGAVDGLRSCRCGDPWVRHPEDACQSHGCRCTEFREAA